MDKDKKRLNNVIKQYNKLKCKNNFIIKRIEAIDGKTIDLKNVNLSIRTKSCFDEPRTTHEGLNNKGQIGCYLSHVKCWELFLKDNNNDYILICEDDIYLTNKLCENGLSLWNELYEKYNKYPLMLMLNNVSLFYKPEIETKELMKTNGRFFGTGAYFLNKNAANVLLKYCFPIEVQVDSYIAFLSKLNIDNFHIFHTKNNIIDFQDVESTINHGDCKNCWLPKITSTHKIIKYKYNYNYYYFIILCIIFIILIIYFNLK